MDFKKTRCLLLKNPNNLAEDEKNSLDEKGRKGRGWEAIYKIGVNETEWWNGELTPA